VGAVPLNAISGALFAAGVLAAWPVAAWSRPQVLSRSPGTNARVVANARGDAAVAWEAGPSPCRSAICPPLRYRVLLAVRRAGGRFGQPQVLGDSDGAGAPRPGIDARGDVLVAWQVRSYVPVGPVAGCVRARCRSSHRRLTRVQEVDARGGANPDVAVSPAGQAAIVWEHEAIGPDGLLRADRVWATSGTANRLAAPKPLSSPAAPIVVEPPSGPVTTSLLPQINLRLALGEDGTLVAAWTRSDGSSPTCCQAVETATGAPGRSFASVERVSAALSFESVDGPAVAVGPDGSTLVAWDQFERQGPPAP
jgi:hypothetical protein